MKNVSRHQHEQQQYQSVRQVPSEISTLGKVLNVVFIVQTLCCQLASLSHGYSTAGNDDVSERFTVPYRCCVIEIPK